MPTNKLSQKYLDNLVLCRGPTHGYNNFPQFAPDNKIYEYLPETDLMEYIRTADGIKVAEESHPGIAEGISSLTQKYWARRWSFTWMSRPSSNNEGNPTRMFRT